VHGPLSLLACSTARLSLLLLVLVLVLQLASVRGPRESMNLPLSNTTTDPSAARKRSMTAPSQRRLAPTLCVWWCGRAAAFFLVATSTPQALQSPPFHSIHSRWKGGKKKKLGLPFCGPAILRCACAGP
jgi:hypothetical protein